MQKKNNNNFMTKPSPLRITKRNIYLKIMDQDKENMALKQAQRN